MCLKFLLCMILLACCLFVFYTLRSNYNKLTRFWTFKTGFVVVMHIDIEQTMYVRFCEYLINTCVMLTDCSGWQWWNVASVRLEKRWSSGVYYHRYINYYLKQQQNLTGDCFESQINGWKWISGSSALLLLLITAVGKCMETLMLYAIYW